MLTLRIIGVALLSSVSVLLAAFLLRWGWPFAPGALALELFWPDHALEFASTTLFQFGIVTMFSVDVILWALVISGVRVLGHVIKRSRAA